MLSYTRKGLWGTLDGHNFRSCSQNSPFQLTSLIYAEKFKFENSAIMEDKQCKQIEWFSAMAKERNYFLLLGNKSKQIY